MLLLQEHLETRHDLLLLKPGEAEPHVIAELVGWVEAHSLTRATSHLPLGLDPHKVPALREEGNVGWG